MRRSFGRKTIFGILFFVLATFVCIEAFLWSRVSSVDRHSHRLPNEELPASNPLPSEFEIRAPFRASPSSPTLAPNVSGSFFRTFNNVPPEPHLFYPFPNPTECAHRDFGAGLLRAWLHDSEKPIEYCLRGAEDSRVECRRTYQARHVAEDNMCVVRRGRISSSGIQVHCDPRPPMVHSGTQQLSLEVFQLELKQFAQRLEFKSGSVSVWWDPTPTLVLERDCAPPYNPFHCMTNLVNAFKMVHMFSIDPNELQIFFDDPHPHGPYIDFWRALGKKGVYLREEWTRLPPERLQLESIFMGIPAGSCIMWKDLWFNTPCNAPSPLFMDMLQYLRAHVPFDAETDEELRQVEAVLDLNTISKARDESKDAPIILMPLRKGSKRTVYNEKELIRAVSRAFPHCRLVGLDFGSIPLLQQIRVARRASLLLGMHGGAFTIVMYLKPTQAVVEFLPWDYHQICYKNLGAWCGMPPERHLQWLSPDASHERGQATRVEVAEVVEMARLLLPQDPQESRPMKESARQARIKELLKKHYVPPRK